MKLYKRIVLFVISLYCSILIFYRVSKFEYSPSFIGLYCKAVIISFLTPSSTVSLISKESESMYPAIKNVDICVIINYPFDKLQIGDVVSVKYEDCKVLHRLVKKDLTGWVTKGDNNTQEDDVILTESNYLGKMVVNLKS